MSEVNAGAYMLRDDHQALADEWRAEKAGLEQIVMAQEVAIAELREGMEAVGAGGVSLLGDAKDALREALKNAVTALDLAQALTERSTHHGTLLTAYKAANAALTQQEQV